MSSIAELINNPEKMIQETNKEKNKLKHELENTNPIEVLSSLSYLNTLSAAFRMWSNEFSLSEEESYIDIEKLFSPVANKHIEYLQRFYYTQEITFGEGEFDIKKIMESLELIHIYESIINLKKSDVQGFSRSNEEVLSSNRNTISYQVQPVLFANFYKEVNEFFFLGKELKILNKLLDDIYEINNCLPAEIEDVLKHYEIEIPDYFKKFFVQKIEYKQLNMNELYLTQFIAYNKKNYLFTSHVAMDNYYYMMSNYYKSEHGLNKFNLKQKEMTEHLTVKYFKKLLKSAICIENGIYKARTGNNEKLNDCEIDAIFSVGKALFICEVKGGLLFQGDYYNDAEATSKSMEGLLLNPFHQSKRFYNALKSSKHMTIKNDNTELKINFSDYDQIILVNITKESLDSIATNADNKINDSTEYLLWSLPLHDLFEYTFLFNSQSDFLNYLYQRKKFSNELKDLHIDDEFLHLAHYINYNDYASKLRSSIDEIEGIENDNIYLSTDDIKPVDHYLFSILSIENKHTQPSKKLLQDENRSDLIKLMLIKSEKQSGIALEIMKYVLRFAGGDLEKQVDKFTHHFLSKILHLKKESLFINYPGALVQIFDSDTDTEICITVAHTQSTFFSDINVSKMYFAYKKVKTKYCIVFGINNKGDVLDIKFIENNFGKNIMENYQLQNMYKKYGYPKMP